jgi:hypothetical protein
MPRAFSRTIHIYHVVAALLSSWSKVGPEGGNPNSMRIDRRYLAIILTILAASTAAMNSASVELVATAGCSLDLKVMAPPARQKDSPVTDRRVRRSVACDALT